MALPAALRQAVDVGAGPGPALWAAGGSATERLLSRRDGDAFKAVRCRGWGDALP